MPAIELKVNTSQAKSSVDSLSQSMDECIDRVKELAKSGNYSEAADIMYKMTNSANKELLALSKEPDNPLNQNGQNNKLALSLDMRLEILNGTINDLTKQLEESTKKNDYKNISNITNSLSGLEQQKQRLEAEKLKLEKEEKEKDSALSKYFGIKEISQALNTLFQGINIGTNYRKDIANGNYAEADINRNRAIGNSVGGALSSLGMATMLLPIPGARIVGGIATGLGVTTSGITNAYANSKEADNAEASVYDQTLKSSNDLNKLFSNVNNAKLNGDNAFSLYKNASDYAKNTGLDVNAFLQSAIMATRFGYSNATDALEMTKNAALYAQSSGADLGTVQNLLGTAKRYGDENIPVSYLGQALKAAGLEKSQSTEFLNALQSVISDGIADGYIKSTEDVAATFAMFNKLSNENPMWQGEQGANRIRKMNTGLASATELQSTKDMIVYQAALDNMSDSDRLTGTYQDALMLMEKGVTPNMFNSIIKRVKELEGGNIAGQMEWYKQIFGVNTVGAYNIMTMANNKALSTEQLKSEIEKIQKDDNYKDPNTERQNVLNSLSSNLATIGKSTFWNNYEKLIGIDNDYKNKADRASGKTEVYNYASNAESAEKANELVKEYNKEVKTANADDVIKNNVDTVIAATALNESKDYKGAVNAYLNTEKIRSAMTFGQINNHRYDNNNFAVKLAESTVGNETFDNIIKKELSNYAAFGEKKGNFLGFGKHKADGQVDEKEVYDFINKANSNKSFQNAYNSGNTTEFLNSLKNMLEQLFGNLTITEN